MLDELKEENINKDLMNMVQEMLAIGLREKM